MAANEDVPYCIFPLDDGTTKALFTVPEDLVQSLTSHPILCRGSSFELQLDEASRRLLEQAPAPQTSILSTEFYSPDPHDTAADISRRLAIRYVVKERRRKNGRKKMRVSIVR